MRISSYISSKNCQLNLSRSTKAISAACLAWLFVGCASKPNPLIGDPTQADYVTAGVAKSSPPPAPAASAPAAPAPVLASTSTTSATTSGTTDGVQTTVANKTWMQQLLYRFTPFRINIHQGNFISQEQISQLKEGMTREQVRFILGTPLVADVFHADRWDYPFRLQKGNGEITASRVTVFFKDEKVARFNGKDLPTEQDYINQLAGPVKKASPAPAESKQPPTQTK